MESLNVPALRQMVSRRTLEHAISSDYRYVIAPALAPYVPAGGGSGESQLMVRATMRDDARQDGGDSQPVAVELHPFNGRSTLTGECSRDMQAFGACVHVTLLALDLANCTPLRVAVRSRTLSKDAAEEARGARRLLAAEQAFDLALHAWTAKGHKVQAVEIAAAPVSPEERERPLGRTYGERPDVVAGGPVLSLSVRRAGERKLLTPRELMNLSDFAPRDRAILEHARDRNSGRKALYATELRATLALDAMRRHGGVFAAASSRCSISVAASCGRTSPSRRARRRIRRRSTRCRLRGSSKRRAPASPSRTRCSSRRRSPRSGRPRTARSTAWRRTWISPSSPSSRGNRGSASRSVA